MPVTKKAYFDQHCDILGSYLQQHHQHHVVRAQFEVELPRWTEAVKGLGLYGEIVRSELAAAGATENTALPCNTRLKGASGGEVNNNVWSKLLQIN